MTPNQITFARVVAGFAAVALFNFLGKSVAADVTGVVLTVAAIALDGVDGYIARVRGLATPLGAQLDILGDRVIENLFFTFFAVSGLISLWVPVTFFARGAATDFLRGLASRAGRTGFGHDGMVETAWGRVLVASRFSRGAYAVLKCVCFCYLGLLLALSHVNAGWPNAVPVSVLLMVGQVLTGCSVAICVLRAVPVLWEGSRFLPARRPAPGAGNRRRAIQLGREGRPVSAATDRRKIGAFFDIDGTLLPAPSFEWRFVSWLEAYGALGFWQLARWSVSAASSLLTSDFRTLGHNKTYLAGLPAQLIDDWAASLSPNALAAFSQGAERIAWHLRQDHRVFLISGTLSPLAKTFARRLGDGVEAYATNLEVVDGSWTGFILGNHMSSEEKARTVARIADHSGISLAESFAYGNEMSDLAMLDSVGNPIAVNPSRHLRRIATERHWRIARWNSAGRSFRSDISSALSSGVRAPEAVFDVCSRSSLAAPSRKGAQ